MASHAFASRVWSCRRAQAEALRRAAERVGAVYQELITLVWDHPAWLDEYFCLTPYQKLMWFAAQGRWHGIARADLFLCTDGRVQCCEVNSDTPSGEAEAVILNRLLAGYHELCTIPIGACQVPFGVCWWRRTAGTSPARWASSIPRS